MANQGRCILIEIVQSPYDFDARIYLICPILHQNIFNGENREFIKIQSIIISLITILSLIIIISIAILSLIIVIAIAVLSLVIAIGAAMKLSLVHGGCGE